MANEEKVKTKRGDFGVGQTARRAESVRREIAPQLRKYEARTGRKSFTEQSRSEVDR